MAIFTLQVPFEKFHGKLISPSTAEGVVAYSSAKAGNVARKYVIPANPDTLMQAYVRGLMTTLATGFKALNSSQAQAWNTAAGAINRTNILNLSYSLSGISLYVMINTYRSINGQTAVATPPSTAAPAGTVTFIAPDIDAPAGATLTVGFTTSGFPNGTLLFWRTTRPQPSLAARPRWNDLGMITAVGDVADHIVAVTTNAAEASGVTPVQYTLAEGNYVGVAVTPLTAAYMPGATQYSAPLTVTTSVDP